MDCPFVVGQKVVCIDPGLDKEAYSILGPIVIFAPVCGQKYTIRGMSCDAKDGVGLLLDRVDNRHLVGVFVPEEPYWKHDRFRPLDSLDQSVEDIMRKAIDDAEHVSVEISREKEDQ